MGAAQDSLKMGPISTVNVDSRNRSFCTNYSVGAAMVGMGAAFLSCFNCVFMAGVAHFAFASSGDKLRTEV